MTYFPCLLLTSVFFFVLTAIECCSHQCKLLPGNRSKEGCGWRTHSPPRSPGWPAGHPSQRICNDQRNEKRDPRRARAVNIVDGKLFSWSPKLGQTPFWSRHVNRGPNLTHMYFHEQQTQPTIATPKFARQTTSSVSQYKQKRQKPILIAHAVFGSCRRRHTSALVIYEGP